MKAQLAITVCHRLERASEQLRFALACARATKENTMPSGRQNILLGIQQALRAIEPALEQTMDSVTALLREEGDE
jgi:hypothetical protein